jgi:hypothetical protein
MFDIYLTPCPNLGVFGVTTEGEEITQPCPLWAGFFYARVLALHESLRPC